MYFIVDECSETNLYIQMCIYIYVNACIREKNFHEFDDRLLLKLDNKREKVFCASNSVKFDCPVRQ